MAEVELEDENEAILKPNWLGKEVTGDTRYYNSYISLHPFNMW
jgi:CYTH domain-containing protein